MNKMDLLQKIIYILMQEGNLTIPQIHIKLGFECNINDINVVIANSNQLVIIDEDGVRKIGYRRPYQGNLMKPKVVKSPRKASLK